MAHFFKNLLRAVCCKDQLRSCNIEKKPRFSQTLPEQRPRWPSSKNRSFRSFRFSVIIFFKIFFCILRSQRPKLTSKSGIFRKLPFKKWKCCRRPYFLCLLPVRGYEPEFLKNFFNLCFATEVTNSQFRRNSRLKRALWNMASPSETTLWGRTIISTTRRAKKKLGLIKRRILTIFSKQVTWAIWATLWPLMSLGKSTHSCF